MRRDVARDTWVAFGALVWSICAIGCDGPGPVSPPATSVPAKQPASIPAREPAAAKPVHKTSLQAEVVREDELPADLQRFLKDRVDGIEPAVFNLPAPNAALLQLQEVPPDTTLVLDIRPGGRRSINHTLRIEHDGRFAITTKGLAPLAPPDFYPPREGERGHHAEGRLSKDELLQLLHQMGEIGFLSIRTEDLAATCEDRSTHRQRIEWTLRLGNASHTIFDDRQCNVGRLSEVQLALKSLEQRIRSATNLNAFLTELYDYAP